MLALAVFPSLFELTKHRLMTIPWFVWAFNKLMAFHSYAHRIVAPYKHAAKALLGRWRARASSMIGGGTLGPAQRAARLVAARRRANGRAP